MKIVFLGPDKESQLKIIKFLIDDNNEVKHIKKNINETKFNYYYDILISYGYKYKINNKILKQFNYNCFNLHISYLPWNKGADPNFWSFAENTPRGVSIHQINEKIDEGPIIFRNKISYNENDTLETSYNFLLQSIENLFYKKWQYLKTNKYQKKIVLEKGSFHFSKDINNYNKFLTKGWSTKVSQIIGIAL